MKTLIIAAVLFVILLGISYMVSSLSVGILKATLIIFAFAGCITLVWAIQKCIK